MVTVRSSEIIHLASLTRHVMKWLSGLVLAAAFAVVCSSVLQSGNTFPDGVKVGFNAATPCNTANKGLLQYDDESSGALHLCNGTAWILVAAPENATVVGRNILSNDVGNESVVVALLHQVLDQLQPARQQSNIFCSGHGTYVPGVESGDSDSCDCYDSDDLGHYVGIRCSECLEGWERDGNGNCVVDVEAPVGTLIGDAVVTVEAGSAFVDDGASFTDNSDDAVVAVSDASTVVDTHVLGEYNVSYTGTDAYGNEGYVFRIVHVVDTSPPVIDLAIEGQTIQIAQYDAFSLPSATANDAREGDVTSSIVVGPALNTSLVGVTEYVYSAFDTSGNEGTASFFLNVSNVDECTLPSNDPNAHDCDGNATCSTNPSGFYDCTCNLGFVGNGRECFYSPTYTFSYTGSSQSFTVPPFASQMHVKAWAAGGGGGLGCFGAPGGFSSGTISVSPGDEFTIVVGGRGVYLTSNYADGGYGGGGSSGTNNGNGHAGSGGGMSGVFTGSSTMTFDTAGQARSVIIAGGGTGGCTYYNQYGGNAGSGGGLDGEMGSPSASVYSSYSSNGDTRRGYPGTQTSGGRGCTSHTISGVRHDGIAMLGGNGGLYGGAGGGGGYFGGGGASPYANGGGGSGYLHPSLSSTLTTAGTAGDRNNKGQPAYTSDPDYVSGVGLAGDRQGHGGNGYVVINLST